MLSQRAAIASEWDDFLLKYFNLATGDEYDPENNPKGYINLGTGSSSLCDDILSAKVNKPDLWRCENFWLKYRGLKENLRLNQALANLMTSLFETSKPIDPNNIITFDGATAVMDILAHCIADPGDVILVPTPVYGRIYTNIKMRSLVDMRPIPIIMKDNKEDYPILTLGKIKRVYNDALLEGKVVRALLIVTPNNPLGDVYSAELLMDILKFCQKHKLHVIIDEIYSLSVFSETQEVHSVLKFPEIPDPDSTHVIYGLSKDFCIEGLRIGCIHTTNKMLQKCLLQMQSFAVIAYPMIGIAADFIKDIKWCKDFISSHKKRLSKKYNYCWQRLNNMGLKVRPSGATFFLWVDFRHICGSESFSQEINFFNYLIHEYHLYIVPGKEFFCEQPGWFRILFAGRDKDLEEGLNRLEEAIKNYGMFIK